MKSLALLLAATALIGAPYASAAPDLRVRGNRLVDGPGRGHVVQLRGVARSGLEYQCISGSGFFESPHPYRLDTRKMVAAMTRWQINAVRVPLNAGCWLGVNTPAGFGGAPYRKIVRRYVAELNRAHLYVILDLHWTATSAFAAKGQIPMADADLAPRFWRSVAQSFSRNHTLLFDLFNEPFTISWKCWRDGCPIPAASSADHYSWPAYTAAGMQQLVDAVRSTGARQPLMLGGTEYALNLSRWGKFKPHDPLGQLVASEHTYGVLAPCDDRCRAAISSVHRHHPVVIGELGETDCGHSYIDRFMPFFDSHGISYLGWAWDAGGGWTCKGGPSLITSYAGAPTPFGIGFRDHLRALGAPPGPS